MNGNQQPNGERRRYGAARDRSQTYNPKNERSGKRESKTGRFIAQKANQSAFKGVRRDKWNKLDQGKQRQTF